MRVVSSTGMSYRINVDDGKTMVDGSLKYADADAMKGKEPKVTAAAYSNSYAGTKETALYDIDAAHGTLVKQAPPNDGILNTIGKLGVKVDGPVAFDVWSDGKGANTGWLLAGGALYTVELPPAPPSPSARCRASRAKSATSPSCRRCSSCSVVSSPRLDGERAGACPRRRGGVRLRPSRPASHNTSPRPSTERLTISPSF